MINKRWSDLSTGSKVALIVLTMVQLSLLVAALWDLARRPAEEIRGSKRLWMGVVFINWVGPLAYFAVGRKDGLSTLMDWCRSARNPAESADLSEAAEVEEA